MIIQAVLQSELNAQPRTRWTTFPPATAWSSPRSSCSARRATARPRWQDILREAGANSGSLYHAFPTKQDVLVAVLERLPARASSRCCWQPAWAGVDDPIERVFALLATYRDPLESATALRLPDRQPGAGAARAGPAGARAAGVNFDGWVRPCGGLLRRGRRPAARRVDRHVLAILDAERHGGRRDAVAHPPHARRLRRLRRGPRDYIDRLEQAASAGRNETAGGLE